MATPENLNSRRLAFDILRNITEQKQPLDIAIIEVSARYPDMMARDRAFARHLITTCLRRLPFLDTLIDGAMDKALAPRDLGTRNWLRLGITQLFYMNVEGFAAVHSVVELMGNSPTKGVRAKKGLANAILRRFSRDKDRILEKHKDKHALNIAPWLRERWVDAYGKAAVNDIALGLIGEPPLDITFKTNEQCEAMAKALEGQKLSEHTCRLNRAGDITELEGFKDGNWWVQDFAATLPVLLMGDMKGKSVADLCAAPGGKTMQLASAGADVSAVDVSHKRLKRLEENLARTKLNAQVVTSNVMKWQPKQKFDGILMDAPCTATGTLRRSPDVPIHKTTDDIFSMRKIQKGLLEHSFQYLKTGGVLIYCTCSLEKEEGEMVVDEFLDNNPDAKRLPITEKDLEAFSILPKSAITSDGDLRTLPSMLGDIGGMDGFFISRLTKASA